MQNILTDQKTLKQFARTMFWAWVILGTVFLIKQKGVCVWFYALAIIFLVLGVGRPGVLKYVYIFWMRLALGLGWINTRIILTVVFYGIMTPLGLLLRLFGKDLLSTKIEKDVASYWIKKENKPFEPRHYERSF